MKKGKRIVVRSRPRREGKTDWGQLSRMTEKEIVRRAKADPDARPTEASFWEGARVIIPQGKRPVTMRIDSEVVDWFKAQSRRYQSYMNAVLRSYMEAHRKAG